MRYMKHYLHTDMIMNNADRSKGKEMFMKKLRVGQQPLG